ncbi:hypothetical protein HMSSN036_86030 [Paenibacillus macerans]|nr:hypothetical protein HMSSN036_86030 [Paenibacillus macerans]
MGEKVKISVKLIKIPSLWWRYFFNMEVRKSLLLLSEVIPMMKSLQRGETIAGLLFVSPMLLGVSVLVLMPILATLVLGFADWNFVQGWDGIRFVGLENFRNLMEDSMFIRSLRNNLIFLLTVPAYMLISMVLAILIDRYVYMKGYFKVAYFMPYISNIVAVAVVWQVLFQPSYGPINELLKTIGFANPPKWIADPNYALISIMMITVWISIGFNMIIYIAGLQSIPKDLYEAPISTAPTGG